MRFSPLDFSLLSPDFGGLFLLNYTENLEKKQKIQWRASSGDGAPKLQISVPCRGRTCPDRRLKILELYNFGDLVNCWEFL